MTNDEYLPEQQSRAEPMTNDLNDLLKKFGTPIESIKEKQIVCVKLS